MQEWKCGTVEKKIKNATVEQAKCGNARPNCGIECAGLEMQDQYIG